MAWRRSGDNPLSEPMMDSLLNAFIGAFWATLVLNMFISNKNSIKFDIFRLAFRIML